jgi:hypothetical protein
LGHNRSAAGVTGSAAKGKRAPISAGGTFSVLTPPSIERVPASTKIGPPGSLSARRRNSWVGFPHNRLPASWGNGWMAALSGLTRAAVDAAYAAAMASGGYDEGGPGLRPHFAPNHYAAYFRDPVLPLRYPRRRYRVQRNRVGSCATQRSFWFRLWNR